MDPLLPYRRTGRTFRMVDSIVTSVLNGERTILWAADVAHMNHLLRMFIENPRAVGGTWLRTPTRVTWRLDTGEMSILAMSCYKQVLYEERTGDVRLRGESHRTRYVMDHRTIELLYSSVIRQWLEFNA